ncbi:MAG TPA: anti-sigma factor antagonist [Desulfonatronum sp.]|nr:anti-sigma factor antagonist [Desulfonatronum sp.]
MELSGSKQGSSMVVKVAGRMDATSAPQFEEECAKWIEQGENFLVVDMGGLEYISSAGLRSILATGKKLKGNGGSLAFGNMQGMVKEVFDISGFTSIFPVYDTLEAALAHK